MYIDLDFYSQIYKIKVFHIVRIKRYRVINRFSTALAVAY